MQNSLTLVIFGATGDLYQNKLSFALFSLFSEGFLPKDLSILAFARKPLTDLEFRSFTKIAILAKNKPYNKEKLGDFLNCIKYIKGDLENSESFEHLGAQMAADDQKKGICTNKLFYLAVPPLMYGIVFKNIAGAGLTVPCAPGISDAEQAWTRVLVEKPFGKNLEDAKSLDKLLGELFDESQIFRIDHYLAKETLQNILSFRFSDGKLEHIWNNKNIYRIKIIFHETNTVGSRGALYDGLGILRDVGQNHMLQMLALVAMENPGEMSVENIRDARKAVLEKTVLLPGEIVRGQYDGYLSEKDVKQNSDTETFFRVTLGVDNERWRGVNFELEAGKALDKAEVIIEVYFKGVEKVHKFNITTDAPVAHDAYEKVLHDCILGDQTVFTTTGEVLAEWQVIEEIIKKWQNIPLVVYPKGAHGEDIK